MGGMDGRPTHEFELSGGALCLDFANTWSNRERPEKEYLRSYPDILDFAVQAGIVTAREAAELSRRARADEREAEAALATARELREAIYRLFSVLAAGGWPAEEELAVVNAALPEALAGLRVAREESGVRTTGGGEPRPYTRQRVATPGFAWTRSDAADSLTAPLRPIVQSAAELLTSDLVDRVRECHGDDCTWLFLDQSRNRSRRWCSMESCGNRAKVRRHYRRQRADE